MTSQNNDLDNLKRTINMKKLQELWLKVPAKWRTEATSISHTFVAAFATQIMFEIGTNGDIPASKEALIALIAAAIRSAWKAIFLIIFPATAVAKKSAKE